jgi:hypothetical protein
MTHDFAVVRENGVDVARCRKCGEPWIGPGEYGPCSG